MSSVDIGQRVEKTADNIFGWDIVDKIPADEVCVLCLGGNGAHEERIANYYAKKLKNDIIDNISSNISVYSVIYNFEGGNRGFRERSVLFSEYSPKKFDISNLWEPTDKDYNPDYIDDLYKKAIEQRISKNNGKERISKLKACQNIRKMTIVAHCHGGYVAFMLERKMQQQMEKLGYSKAERDFIQSQMIIIAHSPACPLGVSKSEFISFTSAMDKKLEKGKNNFDVYLILLSNEEENDYFKPCYFDKRKGNLFLVYQKYKSNDNGYNMLKKEHKMTLKHEKDLNYDGVLLTAIARNITTNAIKHSLSQEVKFTPVPSIDILIRESNDYATNKYDRVINTMRKNGNHFRNLVNLMILKNRNYHKNR